MTVRLTVTVEVSDDYPGVLPGFEQVAGVWVATAPDLAALDFVEHASGWLIAEGVVYSAKWEVS